MDEKTKKNVGYCVNIVLSNDSCKDEYGKRGIFTIILNNNIYFGLALKNFTTDLEKLKQDITTLSLHTLNYMIKNNAECNIVWIANDDTTDEEIINFHNETINEYHNLTSYSVVNLFPDFIKKKEDELNTRALLKGKIFEDWNDLFLAVGLNPYAEGIEKTNQIKEVFRYCKCYKDRYTNNLIISKVFDEPIITPLTECFYVIKNNYENAISELNAKDVKTFTDDMKHENNNCNSSYSDFSEIRVLSDDFQFAVIALKRIGILCYDKKPKAL